jgi:hypothetical protein
MENRTAHQTTILEIQKPVDRGSYLDLRLPGKSVIPYSLHLKDKKLITPFHTWYYGRRNIFFRMNQIASPSQEGEAPQAPAVAADPALK